MLFKQLLPNPPFKQTYGLPERIIMTDMEDRWLSVDEITHYLGVSSDTVYRWIDKFSMPAHRMGRFWKFKKDEVDAWVKKGGADEGKKKEAQLS